MNGQLPEKEFRRVEAIINSMTMVERRNPKVIAAYLGVEDEEVDTVTRQLETETR